MIDIDDEALAGVARELYAEVAAGLNSMRRLEVIHHVMTRSMEVQAALAEIGQHRVPVLVLMIAACAEVHGATVLHHDHDFEVIAGVTDQPVVDALALWSSRPKLTEFSSSPSSSRCAPAPTERSRPPHP